MKIVIFGLSISSSWGNGHATLWRGLCRALIARGHRIVFFERDLPYYAAHRDMLEFSGGELIIYSDWADNHNKACHHLADADVAIATSYCPDAIAATELICSSDVLSVFYDLDTPVTLARLAAGEAVPYIGERGLRDFDLTLSYTGGTALRELSGQLGARHVAPLYGSVDPDVHLPSRQAGHYQADLSYLGTYAADRQDRLEKLFLEPARLRQEKRFVIAGAQYPPEFPWLPNVFFVQHLAASEHPSFFSSSRLTLNITREAMAAMGYCPSGRLFEAAACGAPLVSDWWIGLDQFFNPGSEIIVAHNTDDVLAALSLSDKELFTLASAARERVLAEHTAAHRASELESLLEQCLGSGNWTEATLISG